MNIEYNLPDSELCNYRQILNNINMFSLFYNANRVFFADMKETPIDSNKMEIQMNLNNISGVKLDNYFLYLSIVKTNHGDDKVKYTINNKSLDCENIQFVYFTIQGHHYNSDPDRNISAHHKIVIDYKIDKELYPVFMINLFNKIVQKMFSNFYEYLCNNIKDN
jgi:hypothetical protein